jgi:c-di-GMP-binding flagellar brake protein YcgR
VVKFHALDKDRLAKLNETAPGLEPKIRDYCAKLESVADLLKAKSLERRVRQRLNMPGKVIVQIFDDQKKLVGKPFRGELLDISTSGLAFIFKTTLKSDAMLLGRKLNMALSFDELESDLKIKKAGAVVAVNFEPFNEYIVHVEFIKNLEPDVFDELEELSDPAKD